MKTALCLTASLGVLMACAAPGPVATARPSRSIAAQTPEAQGVVQIVTAATLAAWGRERRDPEALLVAARMLDEVPLRSGPGGDPGVAPVVTSAGLRQEAAALRADQARADEIVVTGARTHEGAERDRADREREAAARAQRLPVQPATAAPPPPPPPPAPPPPAPVVGVAASPFGDGPISTVRRIGSRQTWRFEIEARGAEILRVAAIGDGDTDIDLTVRDASGRLLCADGFGDHYPVCTLSPDAPARLSVQVVNRGALWTRVQVLSN